MLRAEGEGADPARFLPVAYRDLDELEGFLEHLAREVYDPALKALLGALLADRRLRAEIRRAPCSVPAGGPGRARPEPGGSRAPARHHAYLGGLLEHTVAVATMALELCALHPRLDRDLLLSAAIVHDLGKTREFTYGAEISRSPEGRLLGHIELGLRLIAEYVPPALEGERRLALEHCVILHHGPESASRAALRLRRGAGAVSPELARRPPQGRIRARRGRCGTRAPRVFPCGRGFFGVKRRAGNADRRLMSDVVAPAAIPPGRGTRGEPPPSETSGNGLYPPRHSGRSTRMIGEVVVDLGFADRETVEEAVAAARAQGRPTGLVLVERGVLRHDQLARVVAERFGLDFVDLVVYDLDMGAVNLLSASTPPSAIRPFPSASPTTARCCWRWPTRRTS